MIKILVVKVANYRGVRAPLWFTGALLMWGALFLYELPHLQPPAASPRYKDSTPIKTTTASPPLDISSIIDMRVMSQKEISDEVQRRFPSIPITYWNNHQYDTKKGCAFLPSIYNLEYHNMYWQTLHTKNGTFYLYGAYFDKRNSSRIGPAVRVLVVYDRIEPTLPIHCQLWFEQIDSPIIVRNLGYTYMWHRTWGNYENYVLQPYLLTCVLPPYVRHLVPASVSIVTGTCDQASNNLRVYYDQPSVRRKEFAVCVKGLDFLLEDRSIRLVEWIEMILLLGADKIFFYELQLHPNMAKVLKHYMERGVITLTPISLPGGQPNLPILQHIYLTSKITHKRQMEIIPYNDCLYRNMYRYRWLLLLDIDEVIVPLKSKNWTELMRTILPLSAPKQDQTPRSSYYVQNLYYLESLAHMHSDEEDVPYYLHMLRHVYRTKNFSTPLWSVKSFFETDRVLALHNHFPIACLDGGCSAYSVDTRYARLQHYRADCYNSPGRQCVEMLAESVVRDTELWRWRVQLISRTVNVLRTLDL